MTNALVYAREHAVIAKEIIRLEMQAFDKWSKGDLTGFIDLSAEDVVYFDPVIEKRLDGLDKLKTMYEPWQGTFQVAEWEMIDPKVQALDNMAVLTFNFRSKEDGRQVMWNTTEVYRKEPDGSWKIIHTHWSLTKPDLKQQ